MQAASTFSSLFSIYFESFDENYRVKLSRGLQFNDDSELEKNLRNLMVYDLKVINGFFGPDDARKVLCKVSH